VADTGQSVSDLMQDRVSYERPIIQFRD